jgi:subtilisin family serine protease
MVDAAAAVAQAIARSPYPSVPDLGGNDWNLDAINAPEVWAAGYTGQGIVVAVIDTGVDYTHLDLDANIWVNTQEIAGNGIDDDGNGYIDDVRGWDFVDQDNNPMDLYGHGTHVAGTIAAENNGIGITGVAYNAKIMPVKVLGADGNGTTPDVAAGIRYAADNGADVINLSLGGNFFSTDIASAVEYATNRGAMVVMAAGNSASFQPGFPANLANQWGIAVGAVDNRNRVAPFSNGAGIPALNYVVAPGVGIYSTIPGNTYRQANGTSMATPHVAGVVALMLSANPTLTPAQITPLLTSSANPNAIRV